MGTKDFAALLCIGCIIAIWRLADVEMRYKDEPMFHEVVPIITNDKKEDTDVYTWTIYTWTAEQVRENYIKEYRENGIGVIELDYTEVQGITKEDIKKTLESSVVWYQESCLWYSTKYHYMIFSDWEILKTRCEYESVDDINSLLVLYINEYSSLTDKQYLQINSFLLDVSKRLWADVINSHIQIDENKLMWYWKKINMVFSRYHSVIPNQKIYYMNQTYEESYKVNCSWDCLVWAWGRFNESMTNKAWACPPHIPMYTKININWINWVCYDRGWAIKWDRFDNRCGIGDTALNSKWNLSSSCFWGTRVGIISG